MNMRFFPALALVAVIAACDRAAEPTDAPVTAADAPVAADPSPEPLDAAGLGQVCQAVLAAVQEQAAGLIAIDGVADDIASLSWRAPVDGGRSHAQCRVIGDVAEWRLVVGGEPEGWRAGATDPIIRYVREDGRITVIQTFPDGTSARTTVSATDGEAR